MNIHEYQAKALIKPYGVQVPDGVVAETVAEAEAAIEKLGGNAWAVKAQIHAGGRGRAGGVRLVRSPARLEAAARDLLGSRLVTGQTHAAGREVKRIYVERAVEYDRELYLAVLVDRSEGRIVLMGAPEGGEDIEERAAADPSAIRRLVLEPGNGLKQEAAEAFARELGLEGKQATAAVELMGALVRAFLDTDASLIEINPLAVGAEGLTALDVKMVLDDNALFRHPQLEALRDEDETDPSELEAQRFELNYVKLDGNIGVMVNGAGLALATIDLLKQRGGAPADFMDVRPGATREQVAHGFEMLFGNPEVKAVLVNVYGGGILRCDTVAEGLAAAYRATGTDVPVVVRAAGTNAEVAQKALSDQGIPVTFATDMADAASKAVAAAR